FFGDLQATARGGGGITDHKTVQGPIGGDYRQVGFRETVPCRLQLQDVFSPLCFLYQYIPAAPIHPDNSVGKYQAGGFEISYGKPVRLLWLQHPGCRLRRSAAYKYQQEKPCQCHDFFSCFHISTILGLKIQGVFFCFSSKSSTLYPAFTVTLTSLTFLLNRVRAASIPAPAAWAPREGSREVSPIPCVERAADSLATSL